jgi:glycine/D-amino acid oxidase-like deaminating enzyme
MREINPMAETTDVVVIGCGIAGASLSWFLAKRGLRVLCLERERPASGGTGLSAAIMRQHYSTPLMARLAHAAIGILGDAHEELGRDAGFTRAGYLFMVPPEQVDAMRRNVAMQQGLGIDTRLIAASQVETAYPWLNPEGIGELAWEPDGGHTDPQVATDAFIGAAQNKGVELRAKTPVRALLRDGDRVTGVLTDAGEIHAATVVNAAGPWAKSLAEAAGIDLRMRSVREQDTVWEARPGRPLPTGSISDAIDSIYIRPLGDRRFIVGRGFPKEYVDVDPHNYKLTADDSFIADVEQRLTLRIPPMQGARLVHAYAALYDVSVDWYQYVGPRAGLAGYADFSGGSGHGFKEAPAIARELAGWLVDGHVAEDFAQLSYDRVAAGQLFVQAFGGNRG